MDVTDIRGIKYLMKASLLLQNSRPSVEVAADKNDYIKTIFYELHGERYNYEKVNYINARTKIIVTCPTHGDFDVTPYSHLSGTGCSKCNHKMSGDRRTKTQEDFIAQAHLKHDHKYNYDKFVYINDRTKGVITCPTHGDFEQSAGCHSSGSGCRKCQYERVSELVKGRGSTASYSQWAKMGEKSGKFDSYKIYVVICKDGEESFIKVGKTFRTVRGRLKDMPYKYYVHNLITNEDPIEICKIEHEIKTKLKDYRYQPIIPFGGQYECFTMDALHSGAIDELIKNYKI